MAYASVLKLGERKALNRRKMIAGIAASLAVSRMQTSMAKQNSSPSFPQKFLWGAASAGHQTEGNNVSSDTWALEQAKPTVFAEPSGDANNSFELWQQDMDLVKGLGLNSYRFSLEWARIEPEPRQISIAMLDHYRAMVDGCVARGLTPVVTFNHFTVPRWFAAHGGWTNRDAPKVFAGFCERAARHMATGIGYATTLNEPDILRILRGILPPPMWDQQRKMLEAAGRAAGTEHFVAANAANLEDIETMLPLMIEGHRLGRAAIKSVRSDLPVGVSLAMLDDQAVGANSVRDKVRADLYGAWLDAAKNDDFLGVQNSERAQYDSKGRLPPPNAASGIMSAEYYPASLANAVRYAHQMTKLPILVTEHGVNTEDDTVRAKLIPDALTELKKAMDGGVPVKGYIHWALLDNYEWIFGYKPRYGLFAVDHTSFKRTPKPSASVLGAVARRNSL
jgi:beta-glucosidase